RKPTSHSCRVADEARKARPTAGSTITRACRFAFGSGEEDGSREGSPLIRRRLARCARQTQACDGRSTDGIATKRSCGGIGGTLTRREYTRRDASRLIVSLPSAAPRDGRACGPHG